MESPLDHFAELQDPRLPRTRRHWAAGPGLSVLSQPQPTVPLAFGDRGGQRIVRRILRPANCLAREVQFTPCQSLMPRFVSQLAPNVEDKNPILLPIVSPPRPILILGSIPAAARRALSPLLSRPPDPTFLKTKNLARKSASNLLKTMDLRTLGSPPGGGEWGAHGDAPGQPGRHPHSKKPRLPEGPKKPPPFRSRGAAPQNGSSTCSVRLP